MQRFDEEIFEVLAEIHKFSLLVKESLFDYTINTNSNLISDIYKKRLDRIKYLLSKKDDKLWSNFIFENKTKFFEIIDDIQNIENENIKYLEKITKYYGDQIKSINKQKALLIYIK